MEGKKIKGKRDKIPIEGEKIRVNGERRKRKFRKLKVNLINHNNQSLIKTKKDKINRMKSRWEIW